MATGSFSCSRPDPAGRLKRLPFPTKDDVALIDGRPLTITTFLNIRSKLGSSVSTEKTFWVGVAAVALQHELEERKAPLSVDTALNVAFYSVGALPQESAAESLKAYFGATGLPSAEEARLKVDQLVSRAIVQRNPQVLASFQASF